jgi:hypothetical protein
MKSVSAPLPVHSFGGWKPSLFGDLFAYDLGFPRFSGHTRLRDMSEETGRPLCHWLCLLPHRNARQICRDSATLIWRLQPNPTGVAAGPIGR